MRGDLARPVIADAQALELAAHNLDVFFRPVARLNPALNRRLLRRLAKTVPANRVQDVEAAQALVPGQRIPN